MSVTYQEGPVAMTRPLQPALHELALCLHAPTLVASSADGQVRDRGAEGMLHGDVRVLSRAVVTVNDAEPEAVSSSATRRDRLPLHGAPRSSSATRTPTRRCVSTGCEPCRPVGATSSWSSLHRVGPGHRGHRGRRCCGLRRGRRREVGQGRCSRSRREGDAPFVWETGGTVSRLVFSSAHGSTVTETGQGGDVDVAHGARARYAAPGSDGAWRSATHGPRWGPHRASSTWAVPVVRADDRRLATWLERVPRGPGGAAHDHRRHPGRRLRGCRCPLVLHALRPRQPLGRADGATPRHGPRRRDAAHARGPAGNGARPREPAAARQDPARAASVGDGPRRPRHRAAPDLLRHGRRDPAVALPAARRVALGAAVDEVEALPPGGASRPRLAGGLGRPGR